MVGVQQENLVERLRHHRVDLVGLAGHREGHVQEVGGIFEVVARIHEGLADRVFVGHGRNGRHLRDQAIGGDQALTRIGDVRGVVVEGRERTDDATENRHGMSVAPEPAEERVDLLMHHGVDGDIALELHLLGRIRQLALGEEIGDLHEIAVLGELLDRVAAVKQLADITVDVGDL